MDTFWERAAHSIYRMFSLYFDIVSLVISHFGFEGGTLVLIALVPRYLVWLLVTLEIWVRILSDMKTFSPRNLIL